MFYPPQVYFQDSTARQPNPTQPSRPRSPSARPHHKKKDNKLTSGVVPLLFINPEPPLPFLSPQGRRRHYAHSAPLRAGGAQRAVRMRGSGRAVSF